MINKSISLLRKWGLRSTFLGASLAIYQGIQARQEYIGNKLLPPASPSTGKETYVTDNDLIIDSQLKLKAKINELKHDAEQQWELLKQRIRRTLSDETIDVDNTATIENKEDIEEKQLMAKFEGEIKKWKESDVYKRIKEQLTADKLLRRMPYIHNQFRKNAEYDIDADMISIEKENQISNISSSNDDATPSDEVVKRKKIKLLLIGDSLACGVGCDASRQPALPRMLARLLSVALQTEVEWYSAGIVGATAGDISDTLLPQKRDEIISALFPNDENPLDFTSSKSKSDSQLVVVVLCGLNDWRKSLENFPRGKGLESFHTELNDIVTGIKSIAEAAKCEYQIFLPAIPIDSIAKDPLCFFTSRPLKDVVQFISWLWDTQKQAIANNDTECKVRFITSPGRESTFTSSGKGIVSKDRVHPSALGYQWWAVHIATEIYSSM